MSKFEAILPLTSVQESLLVHRQLSEHDQGELHIRCTITGKIDQNRLTSAWNKVVQAHPALRTTVHWEKVKTPVQIIHPFAPQELDFRPFIEEEDIRKDMEDDLSRGYVLNKVFASPIRIYSNAQGEVHHMVWFCHHILMDGWSTVNVLKDWITAYDDQDIPVRPTMQEFIRWKKQQPKVNLEDIKKEYNSTQPNFQKIGRFKTPDGLTQRWTLPSTLSLKIKSFCTKNNLTLNAFFQGCWGIFLQYFSNHPAVSFASSSSGRQVPFNQITELVGLLASAIPIFSERKPSHSPVEFLQNLQSHGQKAGELASLALHDTLESLSAEQIILQLDSLYTFENFPWEPITGKEISIETFESGITANFPMSITVIPHDDINIEVRSNSNYTNQPWLEKLPDIFQRIIQSFLSNEWSLVPIPKPAAATEIDPQHEMVMPENSQEVAWLKIWQETLGLKSISTDDNFFEIGGKSIQAIQMFAKWQTRTGENLSPALLIQKPTIRELAALSGPEQKKWSALVPLQLSGRKNPLFCIHAGGAHVFIYRPLAKELSSSRPVYGIQPYGLDGISGHNDRIADMAQAYWNEIVAVHPAGPVHVLGYCFSTAIVTEMVRIAKNEERSLTVLVVDSAPGLTYGRERLPLTGRIQKLMGMFQAGQYERIREVIEGKWDHFKAKYLSKWESEQMQNFRKVEAHLSQVYTQYNWPEVEQDVHLIRSTEFIQRSDKDIHVEEWKRLASEHLIIHSVEGEHKKLFEEEFVTPLAQTINAILSQHD